MVEWTDFERATIQSVFEKMDYDDVGPAALSRCLVVYPWTQRYFGNFGNLYNAAAIQGNPMVAAHGKTVLHGLDRAVKNMDDIKATYAELSVLHSEKLRVDPDNFRVKLNVLLHTRYLALVLQWCGRMRFLTCPFAHFFCSCWLTALLLLLLREWVLTSPLMSRALSRSSWPSW
uniref:Globin domain-containing protein n=2 Tax=Hucho hucho TaxID=62062 RepID=A0A4W5K970_9TELE